MCFMSSWMNHHGGSVPAESRHAPPLPVGAFVAEGFGDGREAPPLHARRHGFAPGTGPQISSTCSAMRGDNFGWLGTCRCPTLNRLKESYLTERLRPAGRQGRAAAPPSPSSPKVAGTIPATHRLTRHRLNGSLLSGEIIRIPAKTEVRRAEHESDDKPRGTACDPSPRK